MAWPTTVYVATTAGGVYYTTTFAGPSGGQPTWSAVNDGLPATDCREFSLDPTNPWERQYVLLEASRTLYTRVSGGSWTSILTPAEAETVAGQAGGTIHTFWPDASVAGRLWVVYGPDTTGTGIYYWALSSDDYGATWAANTPVYTHAVYTYGVGGIRAYGDDIYCSLSTGAGANYRCYYSTNKAASWSYVTVDAYQGMPILLNPLLPDRVYTTQDTAGTEPAYRLITVTNAGTIAQLQDQLHPPRQDCMWFAAADDQHQRMIREYTLHVTTDAWATYSSGSAMSTEKPLAIAPWAGADEDQIILGLTLETETPPLNHHIIGAMYGEDGTLTGLAGSSPDSSPYTGSIPNTCGAVADRGVQAVPVSPGRWYLHGCAYTEVTP